MSAAIEREWLCQVPGLTEDEQVVYAATRSQARYRYWLNVADAYGRDCIPLIAVQVRAGRKLTPSSEEWKRLGLTEDQRRYARHALGFYGDHKQSWRNHYVIGPGSDSHAAWLDLVAKGLAKRHPVSELTGGMDCFSCTRTLALAVRECYEHLGRDFSEPTP